MNHIQTLDEIGGMLERTRQKSGAEKLPGHDILALERFDPATRHMIVFEVLSHDSLLGFKGNKTRLFLTETGYQNALTEQENDLIRIRNHAGVLAGRLYYDHSDRDL